MTQYSQPTTQTTNINVPSLITLPAEVTTAAKDVSTTATAATGALSGIDTQIERSDLIKRIREYLTGLGINIGGLLIGVVFIVAGLFLMYLEFSKTPAGQTANRTAVRAATRGAVKTKSAPRSRVNAAELKRRSREDAAYRKMHAKNVSQ